MTIENYPPAESKELVQGSGVGAVKTTDGGVVTAAQLSAGATGDGAIVIGVASEAFDHAGGGAAALVGAESAVIDLDDDEDAKPHFGHNAVAKVRMDNALPVRHRILGDSAAYFASAQPETGFQDLIRAQPGSIDRTILQIAGNPGATFARLSGDMVLWRNGLPFLPAVIDGELWGLPLRFLGKLRT